MRPAISAEVRGGKPKSWHDVNVGAGVGTAIGVRNTPGSSRGCLAKRGRLRLFVPPSGALITECLVGTPSQSG
jgi:hypothetical protein